MAEKRSDTLTDSYLEGERRAEPVAEREIDEARRAGHGIREREEDTERPTRVPPRGVEPSDPEDAVVTRRYRAGESVDDHRARMQEDVMPSGRRSPTGPEDKVDVARHTTGDESREAKLRAGGEFESDTERTQLEEDFGERGLRVRGGVHDVRHNPSILDPNADEE
jgi:hypothetical protein